MIVLHAGFAAGRLRLWGESKIAGEPAAAGSPRGRKPPESAAYPFDAGFERLRRALKKTSSDLRLLKKNTEAWNVWLPSRKGQPIASSPLVAEPPRCAGG